LAAKTATPTIPIVFVSGDDPVSISLVESFNRPGGNVTGAVFLSSALGAKRLELLCETTKAEVISFLVNPTNPATESILKDVQLAANSLARRIHVLKASTAREIDAAFAALVQQKIGALLIGADTFFNTQSEQLAALTVRHAVPAIYQLREFAAAGGLMSYGASLADSYRLVGSYAGRMLKGAKPTDLPVQQSTKVELILNLKTAKALGLTVPLPLLGRADEVIE
jgi:putative tryptophan/tyrosine transport system substrate-binding protein